MKRYFLLFSLLVVTIIINAQQVVFLQNGGSLTIQNGAELHLLGGITLDNGSSLTNNGNLFLKNNVLSNASNWTDNSILGALTGTGIVIFNSTSPQQFTGSTQFYTVYINTNQLSLNNDLGISNLLRLIKGKINTTNYVVALINNASSSLENDVTNNGYVNSWINGNLRRSIATNTNSYDFPVGNSDRSNLLQFINNNITGPSNLTASFGPKPGTDAGLNAVENGNTYTAVNSGGVWKLVPNNVATGGNYALQLYFNGFTGLSDNSFGILRRPDASTNAADWIVPTGSLLEPLNGTGRKVSDGFARRYNISDFSQLGIGQFGPSATCGITGAAQVCAGSVNNIFSAPAGMTTYFWSVTGSAGIVGSNTGQTVNISAANTAGSFTLTLMSTLNGIPSQCTKTVTVGSVTECLITGATEFCSTPAPQTYTTPAGMTSYLWTLSAGANILGPNNSASVTIVAPVPGSYQLSLTASNGTACTNQCTKTIIVKPAPPCSITGDAIVTTGTTNNMYTAPAGMTSYNWGISGYGAIVGSATGATVNVTAGAAGSYTLTLTTTLNDCPTICSKTVTVNAATTYACNIAGASEVCSGALQNVYTAPAGLSSYSWNITGNGSINGSHTGSSVIVTAGAVGTYTLNLEMVSNGVSCSSQKFVSVNDCVNACSYTQGFYGNEKGVACYNNSGTTVTASQLMLNAFAATNSKVFGNVTNKRLFTLYKSDITTGAIYKMLPGGGNANAIDEDKQLPFDGAYYSNQTTWSLVPLQPNGPQKGKIRNSLLAATITLWFNLENSAALGSINLTEDTLLTKATASCGSNTPVGEEIKSGLPHDVIVYLNGGNGYPATIDGLFALANDVLGGVNTTIKPSTIQQAVDVINNAFDGCRVLTGTIPYSDQLITSSKVERVMGTGSSSFRVTAYPNPYKDRFQLIISSPVNGAAKIEFFNLNGQKVYEMKSFIRAGQSNTVQYSGAVRTSTLIYKVTIGEHTATGIVINPN